MRTMNVLGSLTVMAMASSSVAAPPPAVLKLPLCDAIKKIAAAGVEQPSFSSIVREAKDGTLVGKILPAGFTTCSVVRTGGKAPDSYTCTFIGANPAANQAMDAKAATDLAQCTGSVGTRPGGSDDRGAGHLVFPMTGTAKPTQAYKVPGYGFGYLNVGVEVGRN